MNWHTEKKILLTFLSNDWVAILSNGKTHSKSAYSGKTQGGTQVKLGQNSLQVSSMWVTKWVAILSDGKTQIKLSKYSCVTHVLLRQLRPNSGISKSLLMKN